MQVLKQELRSQLERTIREARDVAEAGARAALTQLGYADTTPPSHLDESARVLRRRLRAHGRQLGPDETILIDEIAYEHWHRMLFARFLAENGLLMYPDPVTPTPVTLQDCIDLAAEEGAHSGWELAARYATTMLPQVFRVDSPVHKLQLPPEHQLKLESLLAGLPADVFQTDDALGWVYQYWQAKRKDEVNASEMKIGAKELPAVTQLFTEDYMVSFLLDNSLGAWWAERCLSVGDLETAKSEDDLRAKASLPGMPLEYLRFIHHEGKPWQIYAGSLSGLVNSLSEFKVLDPCCGSGHFLLAMFHMLVPLRMELENLNAPEAIDAVLKQNLHGLEVDQRCVEIAAFAVALAAWRYPGSGGYRRLPRLNLACTGLTVKSDKDEWLAQAEDDERLRLALSNLYEQFSEAAVLGSLISPREGIDNGSLLMPEWDEVKSLLRKALSSTDRASDSELGVLAHGLTEAADMLSRRYDLVATNVPYLARTKQVASMAAFCDTYFPQGKNNLSDTFIMRCINFCKNGGLVAVVAKDWQYQAYEQKFRRLLLQQHSLKLVAALGAKSFSTPMFDFNVVLSVLERTTSVPTTGIFAGIDVSGEQNCDKKATALKSKQISLCSQKQQLSNPDARILLDASSSSTTLLQAKASYQQGICTGDLHRFQRKFWELSDLGSNWSFQQSTVSSTVEYGGLEHVLLWEKGTGQLFESVSARLGKDRVNAWLRGRDAWGKRGVAVSSTGVISVSLYNGDLYDDSTMVLIPKNEADLPAVWAFCSSPEYNQIVRGVDRKLNARSALVKVPFNLSYWQRIANEQYPNGLPEPQSNDPTQWVFHGCLTKCPHPLQVAMARLLGYRWPAERDSNIELSKEAHFLKADSLSLASTVDSDGIVCISPVRGESGAADKLLSLLANIYGAEWGTPKLDELLATVGYQGKTLENWLRDGFFTQHCKLFHQRPFIWQVWDGLRDGFSAFLNYHQLDRKKSEILTYNYLGDWIARQRLDLSNGVDGAQERLSAAEGLLKRLQLILEGEAPYDIFVRWKPLEEQPKGWNPDINDGVRLNIRPFMTVPDVGRKGAGILRERPAIKWDKDRGKDVESAPWYKRFGGERINDYHLTLAEKGQK